MNPPQADPPDDSSPAFDLLTEFGPPDDAADAPGAPEENPADDAPGDLPPRRMEVWLTRLRAFLDTPSFGRTLAIIAGVALAVRWGFIYGFHRDLAIRGDAWVYYYESRLNGVGYPFIDPGAVQFQHIALPAADHPPMFIFILTALNLLGIHGFLSQIAANGLLGVAAVVVIGLVGRRIGGARIGLVAAVIAALYPGLWSWNGLLLSETTSALATALTLLFAYRYWDDRRTRDLVWLSLSVCMAMMSHGELLLYFPFIVLPLLVSTWRREHELGHLLKLGGVVVLVTGLALGPWIAFNLSRFEEPTFITTNFGRTFDSGACGDAYFGDTIGFWDISCIGRTIPPGQKKTMDQSELDKYFRDEAFATVKQNPGQFVVVAAARVGRLVHLYRPTQQVAMDQSAENREWWVSGAALSTYYLLAGFAIAGAVSLRRRRRPVYPLLAAIATSLIGAVVAFGTTRYRAPSEPAIVLLAAVGADAAVRLFAARRAARAVDVTEPDATESDATGPDEQGTAARTLAEPATNTVLLVVAATMVATCIVGMIFMRVGGYDIPVPKLPSIGPPGLPR